MAGTKTEYELERDRRIAENKQKILALGILETVEQLKQQTAAAKPAKRRRVKTEEVPTGEIRRSQRPKQEVNYCDDVKLERVREPVDYSGKIKAMQLDEETAEKLRQQANARMGGSDKHGKKRGPVDSGKGVRIQGGKVYDSKYGVTCHWCRQKTLEDHVTCSSENCGKSKRMPLSFCNKCLKNRHGEEGAAAAASGQWVCPCCRGSCGAGCVICCNCGPCRKKAGLEPTHQVVKLAREAGFDNVHDYLVHLVTGEDAATISSRKGEHPWGQWVLGSSAAVAVAAEPSSGASEHTADGDGDDTQQQPEVEEVAQAKVLQESKKQAAAAKITTTMSDYYRKSKPGSHAGKAFIAATKAIKPTTTTAAAAAKGVASKAADDNSDAEEDQVVVASQGAKSRKLRMMQKMGLAPLDA